MLAAPGLAGAQGLPNAQRVAILSDVGARAAQLAATAKTIWDYAEVGFQETGSSALLQQELKKAEFTIDAGVAEMPTAFVAHYRNGHGPVIAVLAEFDALPGLAQGAKPEHAPIAGKAAGHGCGHNIFGAATMVAAAAIKDWMTANNVHGEIGVCGTPAQEGGYG
jgi:aminobenzoyl-glutamate utilization protein B